MTKEIHILPFFTKYKGEVKFEHVDLQDKSVTIRGINCIKKSSDEINPHKINVYLENELIKDWIYWMPINLKSTFLEGLELVKKGIGFNKSGILKFIKK